MGIHPDDIELIESAVGLSWHGVRMAVLGSQTLRRTGRSFIFEARRRGAECVGLDLNGLDSCVQVDLSAPMSSWPIMFEAKFDIVLNFGTSEHCGSQHDVFANVHSLCRAGGYMVHNCPLVGFWPGHSPYKYGHRFFPDLAAINEYEVISCEAVRRGPHRRAQRVLLRRRGGSSFVGIPESHLFRDSDYVVDSNNRS